MDALTIAKDLVIPALSMMGSAAAAFVGYRHRVDGIEKKQLLHEEEVHKREDRYTKDALKREDDLKRGFQLEIVTLKDALARLEAAIHELKQDTGRLRDSSADFAKDAELSRYITEENRKWNEIQRLLGQIEGRLERMK